MTQDHRLEPEARRAWFNLERGLQALVTLASVGTVLAFIVMTLRWPLVWDETVMHTVNLLMAHGFAPYRDIYDMNMPAMYLIDGWQMHLFGPGDLALRVYEFVLLALLMLATTVIAGRRNWAAGLLAGAIFVAIHGSEGPRNATQRDEVMTVVLLVGCAFLFAAVRHRMPTLMLLAGTFLGLGVAIKPTVAPLALGLFGLMLWELGRRDERRLRYVSYGCAGAAIPAAMTLGFLLHYHAVGDFVDLSTRLTTYYNGLMVRPIAGLLLHSVPTPVKFALAVAVILAVVNRVNVWERWALLLGAAGGLISFLVQRKGYAYQRYPLLGFLLVWICLELFGALRRRGWMRYAGALGIVYCSIWVIPRYVRTFAAGVPYDVEYMSSLEGDLTRLGGERLQRQVQCLDMVDGCLGALYHLGLVQNTGFTGDTLFFVPGRAPAAEYYRAIFWRDVQTAPPQVFVLSNERFGLNPNFDKLDEWPEFKSWLSSRYDVVQERNFDPAAYRIYVLKSAR